MITSILFALAIQGAPACDCPYADIPVVGHRGSGDSKESNPFAENTVPSVRNAYEEGAEWAEIDVHLSSDGAVVVHHDFTLGKTVGGLEGCVVDASWSSELDGADATHNSGAAAGSATVPQLAEVLRVTLEFDRKLLVELKVEESGDCVVDIEAFVDATIAEIKAESATENVMIISFSFEALEYSRQVAPEIPVGFLTAEFSPEVLNDLGDDALEAGFTSINPLFASLTIGQENTVLADLKAKGLQVVPWTVDTRNPMEILFQGQVDGIITNEVSLALAVRAEQCAQFVCPVPPEVESSGGCMTAPQGAAPLFPVLAAFAWLALRRRVPVG